MTPVLVVMDRMYGNGRGGTERQVLRLLPALRREGIEPSLLFLRSDPWHTQAVFDVPWRELAVERLFPFGILKGAREVCAEAQRRGARVIVSFFDDAMAVAALARMLEPRLRFIATQRTLGTERGAVKQVWVGWSLRRADRILVNSIPVKERVCERYKGVEERVCVIENLPVAPAAARGEPAAEVRTAALELRNRSLAVGTIVANLRPVKGVQDVIDALAMEPAKSAAAGVVVMGDGPSRVALETQAMARGVDQRIRFAGHVDDVSACLPLFDFGILPSHAEGSANAGFEFTSASLPFIATAVGGNVALLEGSGGGVAVAPRQPAALSRAIAELAANPSRRKELGARGKAFSDSRPTAADVTAAHAQLIKRLADSEAGA